MATPERRRIEMTWQGEVLDGRISYRDEGAGLLGEAELVAMTEEALVALRA
ncbi:hypothetical protein [Methylobrevis pamukkalensis]|uniref:Uncharacterized protein n=1 Tax=Methylobrevis pamukkalensis TaxID=1439726 RepID=A0A1E3H7D1_9HYPH|nr:hypothetical protein [Methylobrevis pamukkalensis]ODN72237.1 hypothetical protein A6302_00426 [Methylobrevis pamukkalensis]